MASTLRKRQNASSKSAGDLSPDSSTGTDPLMVEYPQHEPSKSVVKTDKRSSLVRFLAGYSTFMGKGIHQDRGLKILQWTLWLFAHAYKDRESFRVSCRKLYNELSFARYALRLLGLPDAVAATQTDSWAVSSETHKNIHKFLGKIMAWSMIGYYPLEHLAYIQWQAPKLFFPKIGGPSRLAEKLSAWSCRFWCVYIAAEIVQSLLTLREESQILEKHKTLLADSKKGDTTTEEETQMVIKEKTDSIRSVRLQIVRDLLFSLPAIHWSLPKWDTDPWLSEPVCNTLMWLESAVCMYQSVTNFNN